MIKIDMRADISKALAKLDRLKENVRDKAAVAAINKTIAKANTEMVRQITAEFNVIGKDIRPQLSIDKASWKAGKLTATLSAFDREKGHRGLNLIHFDAKQVIGRGKPKRINVRFPDGQWRTIIVREGGGVSVKIKRKGKRKLIRHAFIGNKGRTVFVRSEDGRSIRSVKTIDVPQMFNMRRINTAVLDRIKREFPIEMDRALRLYGAR